MTRARIPLVLGVCVAVLAAAVLLGVLGGSLTPGPDRIPVSQDTFALAAEPQHSPGDQTILAAGGYAGGAAVSYVKFDVELPAGRTPDRAWLWLGRHDGPLPDLIELTEVPDTGWNEGGVNAGSAPRLGRVIGSVWPGRYDQAVAFDITEVIRSSGSFAFAVTAPTSTQVAKFVAREAAGTSTGPPTITLEWPDATQSAGAGSMPSVAPSRSLPVLRPWPGAPSGWAAPTSSASPIVVPWPGMSPSATVSISASPSASLQPSGVQTPAGSPSHSDQATATPGSEPSESPNPTTSPDQPSPGEPSPGLPSADPSDVASPSAAAPSPADPTSAAPSSPAATTAAPSSAAPSSAAPSSSAPSPSVAPSPDRPVVCEVGRLLVPTCGSLSGVAPAAHTRRDRIEAMYDWEKRVTKPQQIYHAYHRGDQMFPTGAQVALARDHDQPRLLFLNWKPMGVTWGEIAAGHSRTDTYLDRLSRHIRLTFNDPFFFTMHHEPENDVIEQAGSGMTAKDYAAAFRYVVKRLRGNGVSNLVTTMCFMAYVPWNTKSWFPDLYPGDDVVDWVSWDTYAYSEPGYGYGDFAELMNRRSGSRPNWPGFYNWAAKTFPNKPLMVAEWGVWHSRNNPGHQAKFFDSVRLQLELFPRIKALVYFESPDAEGRDSRIDVTPAGLKAYRDLQRHPAFDVRTKTVSYAD